VLYNGTEYRRSFIYFMIKNLFICPHIQLSISKPNFNFQTRKSGVSMDLFSDEARLNEPITILVRIAQIT